MTTEPGGAESRLGEALPNARICIVGAGFSGIGMAVKLRKAGVRDFVVLERAADLGGTWRDNTYPGCKCDIPSHIYSYSFAPNPDWTQINAPQPEIWAYLRSVAEAHSIAPHLRFGHEVLDASWDDADCQWLIQTNRGEMRAEVLISAMGALSNPSIPAIPGREAFAGASFHSSRWDHEHDLSGERVAVVGTGASAAQLIPKIAPRVAQLTVFQRTPHWVLPSPDRPTTARARRIYRRFALAQKLTRAAQFAIPEILLIGQRHPRLMAPIEAWARRYLSKQVSDPGLRAKLTPRFRLGCKRIVLESNYLATLDRPDVNVVTEPLRQVTETAIVTADGIAHDCDTIIWATGFSVQDPPLVDVVRGRGGRTLRQAYHTLEAHRGTTVAGFPNLFILLGPNTGVNNSIVYTIESQIGYVILALETMDRLELATVEPRFDVQIAYNESVQRAFEGTVWTSGGCRSWYLDSEGRNTTLWPLFSTRFRRMLSRFDVDEYAVTVRSSVDARQPPAMAPGMAAPLR